MEEIGEILSCDSATADEGCAPLYDSAVSFIPLQLVASQACSFECVVGEQMCDDTLHPDYSIHGIYDNIGFKPLTRRGRYSNNACPESSGNLNMLILRRKEFHDEYGVKHTEILTKDLETGCKEWTEYVEICRSEGDKKTCQNVTTDTEEWFAYQRELQMKQYEESCFVPTEEDCKNVNNEIKQCMWDVTKHIFEFFCASSKDNLWNYRKYGAEGTFLSEPVKFEVGYPSVEMDIKSPENIKPEGCVKLKDGTFEGTVSLSDFSFEEARQVLLDRYTNEPSPCR